jgi:hypothetical protein
MRSEELTPAEFEAELRSNLAAQGEEPADWLIAEIRSGRWKQRQRQNMQNLLRNQVRLVRLKREGYTFDSKHRLVAPALTRIHAPLRRESGGRPRGRRVRRSARTGARGDPHLPDGDEDLDAGAPLGGAS